MDDLIRKIEQLKRKRDLAIDNKHAYLESIEKYLREHNEGIDFFVREIKRLQEIARNRKRK